MIGDMIREKVPFRETAFWESAFGESTFGEGKVLSIYIIPRNDPFDLVALSAQFELRNTSLMASIKVLHSYNKCFSFKLTSGLQVN